MDDPRRCPDCRAPLVLDVPRHDRRRARAVCSRRCGWASPWKLLANLDPIFGHSAIARRGFGRSRGRDIR